MCVNHYLLGLMYHHYAGATGQSVCRRCCLSMPWCSCSTEDSQQKLSALVSPAKLQLCLSPEPCPAGYLAMLRWPWTLTGSPAVLGSGRSFTVITSQGTPYRPGKAWLLPSALTLRFNQGGNHLCGIKEEALLQDELGQNWIFWVSAQF